MVVAWGDGCQRDKGADGGGAGHAGSLIACYLPSCCRTSSPLSAKNRNPARGAGLPQGGACVKKEQGVGWESCGTLGFRGGGAAGGLSRRPCGHCINEGGVCWSLSGVLWALCRRSPWRPLVASGGYEPPAGDTVRTGGGRSGTVRVQFGGCRCARIASVVRAVALARRPLPRIHCPCPSPQGGTGERPGAAGERDATRPPVSAKRLAGFPCRPERAGPHVGLPSGASPFPLCLRTADAGGRGGRRNRRVAAVRLSRGIRLGLALCEGQRCHALMGN